jgi:hypothetical protein
MNADREPQYQRRPGVVARRVAGELLLVPLAGRAVDERARSAELYVLNHTGEFLWENLSSPITMADLARKLMDEFKITAELARADAEKFLESLREVGAVSEADSGEPDGSR